jgi:hypothetical protein
MIAPGVSNGEAGPKSMTKPVFFEELSHVTVVPTFTQKIALALAPGIFGVADAQLLPLRLISIRQGSELDPHVLAALHIPCAFDSVQPYDLLPRCRSLAPMQFATKRSENKRTPHQIANPRSIFTRHLDTN